MSCIGESGFARPRTAEKGEDQKGKSALSSSPFSASPSYLLVVLVDDDKSEIKEKEDKKNVRERERDRERGERGS